MIGVVSRAEQKGVIEEFFQLFKTPWEFFHEGRAYDVVIVTGGEPPSVEAKLLLIFGSEIRRADSHRNLTGQGRRGETLLRHRDS